MLQKIANVEVDRGYELFLNGDRFLDGKWRFTLGNMQENEFGDRDAYFWLMGARDFQVSRSGDNPAYWGTED